MATDKEYQALIDSLSGECERLHKENEELKALSQEPCKGQTMTREEAKQIISDIDKAYRNYTADEYKALEMAIQALSQEPCGDAEQIDYHDDFATALKKMQDYKEQQNDKKCGSYNNTNTFKSCINCKLIGTDSCYMVCGGSKSLYKPKQKIEPCEDAISREAAIKDFTQWRDKMAYSIGEDYSGVSVLDKVIRVIKGMPSVTQKSGKCKNCKYFEYDSVAKVDGIPLIVAHEICNKWGDGCKTNEDGYCYLFEPQERSKGWINFAEDLIPIIDDAESEDKE